MNCIKFYILFIISFLTTFSLAQTNISGVINQYGSCVSFTGNNSLIVTDASLFHVNDTILIIQMMGAQIDHSNNNNYGTITNLNNTGNYEFNIIDSINSLNNILFFKCAFINTYSGVTQIVKVPRYINAIVNATLTAQPWNGSTGGVLAFFVQNSLTLNADINVNGKGFRGAYPSYTPNHICPTTSTGFLNYYYTSTAIDSAGFKGEGISGTDLFYSRGRGKNATGGGGGHTYDAAGGGGSCYGSGGKGGTESDSCSVIPDLGGYGGADLTSLVTGQVKLFLGGGGGAGLFESIASNDATAGGNGGGIIIIMAGSISGNLKNILANGDNVTGITSNESAGGGGGGGSIAIYSPNIIALTSIQAKGGDGGSSTNNCRGSGGGGGGGIIAIPNVVTGALCNVNGGFAGSIFNTCFGSIGMDGNNGTLINNLVGGTPQCFLTTPITNNNISTNQQVCMNVIPATITGSIPVGGNNSYSYQWEQSLDGITWVNCPGGTSSSFTFSTPLPQTTHFRRIIISGIDMSISNEVIISLITLDINTSSTPTTCYGTCDGKAEAIVTGTTGITYHWNIGNNTPAILNLCSGTYFVTASQTSSGCTDTASVFVPQPLLLNSSISSFTNPACHYTSDGNATVSTSGGTQPFSFIWNNGQNSETANNLFPGTYSVSVTDSNGCIDSSSILLTAQTIITNNNIDNYLLLCGTTTSFIPIMGNLPDSVDSTVLYLWIQNPDTLSNSWTVAPITNSPNNFQNYIPPNPGSSPIYYARIVNFNGCTDTSNICKVYVYLGSSTLGPNTISPDSQALYISQIPSTIYGNNITGGIPGDTLQYLWGKSINEFFNPWTIAFEGTYQDTNLVFTEGADTSFYYFRFAAYIVNEMGVYKQACTSFSNFAKVHILFLDTNTITISDSIICSGTTPPLITGNVSNAYTYQWQTYDGTSWINIPGAISWDYQPGVLTSDTMFIRITTNTNNGNILTSNIITIHVLPNITNNVIYATNLSQISISVCEESTAGMGSGTQSPTGGTSTFTYHWQQSTNNIDWNPATTVNFLMNFQTPVILDTMYFRRYVISDNCESYSNVITVYPIILNVYAGEDTVVCGNTFTMNASHSATGTEWWSAPSWITLGNASSPSTSVTTSLYVLSQLYWHLQVVTSGVTCTDSSKITIEFYHTIAQPNAGTDITLLNSDSTKLDATPPPYGTGSWSLISGGGTFDYSYDCKTWVHDIPPGENIYRWKVSNGSCIPLFDDVSVTTSSINIPQGFSPNGDGINDLFEISGIDYFNKSELIIFNRWGNEVYKKSPYDNTWDGKNLSGKPLAEDTYFYVLILNEKETKKSFLILKR